MKFAKYLYIGNNIKNPIRTKWKLRHHAGQFTVYVITLSEGSDQLEIYHCAFLQQKYYRQHPPYIVGLASGYSEAVELVIQMAEDSMKYSGTPDIKSYLRQRNHRGNPEKDGKHGDPRSRNPLVKKWIKIVVGKTKNKAEK